MKLTVHFFSWHLLLCIALLLFGIGLPLRADDQNKAAETHWTIIAECQMVVVPQKLAWPLLPDLNDDEKIEGAWAKLQQMIEHGDATLIANLSLRGDAGKRMVAEEVQEIRYPTEFAPPYLPDAVPKEHAAEVLKNWPVVSITPTAFETRNVGTTLELETNVSADGKWLALQAVPQHVRLLHMAKIDAGILPSRQHLSVEQPYFSVLKDTLTMHLRAGQRVLVGLHKVPTEETNMELFFLRIRTQPENRSK